MSMSLLVFVPVALLFIVSGFCFIGCVLDRSGLPGGGPGPETPPPNNYSGNDVLKDPSIVAAYWPLSEPSGTPDMNPATAHDIVNGHDGTYVHKGNAPMGTFPCPKYQVAPGIDSALELGGVALGVTGIVPGDGVQPPANPIVLKTGMTVTGAYVTVPLPSVINPPAFTVEAWVRPEWDPAVVATRAVVDSRGSDASGVTGFVLWVNNDGNWEVLLNGTGGQSVKAIAGPALAVATHVVLTFDGNTNNVAVFINGTHAVDAALPPGSTFNPNTTEPLIIGAGFKFLPDRSMAMVDLAFPSVPFNGTIQDVAIYNTVLADAVIKQHTDDGNAVPPAGS
jgi:hypothetical protein